MKKRIGIPLDFDSSTKTKGKFLIFDTETTGFPIDRYASPDEFENWPYVLQIAWILFDDEHKLIEHNNCYVKQTVEIPADATNVHGITKEVMLEKGIEPSMAYAKFKEALKNTKYLVAHNIDFDVPIVHCEFLRNGMQWDFPENRMLCTMKAGTDFCKIPPLRNGEYKWPKLEELFSHCFFPGQSIEIFSDATSTSRVHKANIDAAMTAQCFFKLKDLGYFKEHNNPTANNKSPVKQTSNDFKDLHEIIDRWESDNGYWWYTKIKHRGLDVTKTIKDEWSSDYHAYSDKVVAQFKKWDEQWARVLQKKEAQTDKEIAEERTKTAQEIQKQIDDLLIRALEIDNSVDWDLLKNTEEFDVPNPKNNLEPELGKIINPAPPIFREIPEAPDKGQYAPQLSIVDKAIKSRKEKKTRQAELLYEEAMKTWKQSVDEIKSSNSNLQEQHEKCLENLEAQRREVTERYAALGEKWLLEKESFYKSQKEHNDEIDRLKKIYLQRNREAVIRYSETVLSNSRYPETFPKDFDLDYNPDTKILIVEYILPSLDDVPKLTNVRYVASKKEFKESFLSDTQFAKIYESTIYKITLRTLYELFQTDRVEALESIIFNGWVNAIDKATGKKSCNCIVSIKTSKAEFNEIELSGVDPKMCFQHFRGIGSSKLVNGTAIDPIAQIIKRL